MSRPTREVLERAWFAGIVHDKQRVFEELMRDTRTGKGAEVQIVEQGWDSDFRQQVERAAQCGDLVCLVYPPGNVVAITWFIGPEDRPAAEKLIDCAVAAHTYANGPVRNAAN